MSSTSIRSPASVPAAGPKREHVASKQISKLKGTDKRGRGRPPKEDRDDSSGKKKKSAKKENFSTYIYRVLKQVHPEISITTSSMGIMNSMMMDLMERIASEASRLLVCNKRQTMSSRDIQTAVKLILGGELGSHAVSEGTKAIAQYTRNAEEDKSNRD